MGADIDMKQPPNNPPVKSRAAKIFKKQLSQWQLYLLVLLPVAHMLVFAYWPMYGAQIAFKDFRADLGIWGSEWVGLKHFIRFFENYRFSRVIVNTFRLGVTGLVFGFPIPILFAIMLNELTGQRIKKAIQTVSFAPYFISVTVLVGMLFMFLDARVGPINNLMAMLGGERTSFMGERDWFIPVFVISGVWQGMGYSAVIYLAALSGVDQELYEAAIIDGASRVQKIYYIDIPGISPTIVILLILSAGQVMNIGFEKAFLMQNGLNQEVSEIISTYVYRSGLLQMQYSFSSAVGLFNSVMNCTLLIVTNLIARQLGETSLF